MASSPPESPGSPQPPPRPLSSIARPAPRSTSRLSMSSRAGAVTAGGSRASDEDSRTAVRVAVRVRPPLAPTDPGYDLIPQRFQRSMVHTTSDTNIAIDSPQGRKLFVFDRVFSPDVTQEGVWDYLSDSISAFTRGYNVSLLAYGQSGAGKSYTMGTSGPGEQHDNEMMGTLCPFKVYPSANSRVQASSPEPPLLFSTSSILTSPRPTRPRNVSPSLT
jgi:hypothetical protein